MLLRLVRARAPGSRLDLVFRAPRRLVASAPRALTTLQPQATFAHVPCLSSVLLRPPIVNNSLRATTARPLALPRNTALAHSLLGSRGFATDSKAANNRDGDPSKFAFVMQHVTKRLGQGQVRVFVSLVR